LKHKAEVVIDSKPLKVKMNLDAIILNVAGTSQNLKPEGDDVLGLNIPNIGEFMTNSGSFNTTYVDDTLRISRGKVGKVDQLRVFTKIVDETPTITDTDTEEVVEETVELKEVTSETKDEEKEPEITEDDVSPSD